MAQERYIPPSALDDFSLVPPALGDDFEHIPTDNDDVGIGGRQVEFCYRRSVDDPWIIYSTEPLRLAPMLDQEAFTQFHCLFTGSEEHSCLVGYKYHYYLGTCVLHVCASIGFAQPRPNGTVFEVTDNKSDLVFSLAGSRDGFAELFPIAMPQMAWLSDCAMTEILKSFQEK